MSSDADRLRRSKRNKFFLDVAALNSAKTDRRRTQPHRLPSPSPLSLRAHSASPSTLEAGSVGTSLLPDDDTKRARRQIRNNNYVYDDDSEEEEDAARGGGMAGSHMCSKCPSRFETRPGLANHFKLHGVLNRKFKCEQCDFSCGSAKAIRNHRKCHGQPLTEHPPSPAHSDTRSDTSGASRTPPELTPQKNAIAVFSENSSPPQLSAVVPHLSASASDSQLDRKWKVDSNKLNSLRNRCGNCPFASRNRRRFETHLLSHGKSTGFRCHSCTLTTPSSGFLKRHITEVHKEISFPWPPQYVVDGKQRHETLDEENLSGATGLQWSRKNACRARLYPRECVPDPNGLRCPVSSCTYLCHTKSQMVSHKHRTHTFKSRFCRFRCSRCGLFLRTPGALRLHRTLRHVPRSIHPKVKTLLIGESMGRHFLRAVCTDLLSRSAATSLGDPALDDSPPSSGKVTPLVPPLRKNDGFVSENGRLDSTDGMNSCSQSSNGECTFEGIKLPEYLRSVALDSVDVSEANKFIDQPFKCEECPFGTNARSKLDRHVAKHTVRSDLDCPSCSFSCRGDDIMQQHFRLHVVFVHKQRSEAARAVSDLAPLFLPSTQRHTPTSSELPSPVNPRVRMTNERLSRKKNAPTFTKVVMSDGTKMRRCLECPYVTKHSCDLSTHYQMHLSVGQRYKCTQCSYSTKRSVCLKTHYQQHREQNAKESTARPLALRANGAPIGTRQGVGKFRIYVCRSCPFVSRTLVALWMHARSHLFRRGALIRCSACEYYGIRMEALEDHLLLHNSDDLTIERVSSVKIAKTPPQRFQCDECPFVSSTYQQNWNHKQKHKKSSRYPCPFCTFSIGSEICLREHIAIHGDVEKGSMARLPSHRVAKEENRYSSAAEVNLEPCSSAPVKMEFDRSQSSSETKPRPLQYDAPLRVDVLEKLRPPTQLMAVLEREVKAEDIGQCPDCPFADADPLLFRIHRDAHGASLPHRCDLCSYSCLTPENLHHHISLHLPLLSPNSAAAERRRSTHRRRFQSSESIPSGVPHFSCPKCNFRTMTNETFMEHMKWHAQDLQRRLVTTIKRTAIQADEGKRIKAARRTPKKADKFHSCAVCCFRCETLSAFSRHSEMHTLNGIHSCSMCSYTANTKSIVNFHEMNHHLDHSLTNLNRCAVLTSNTSQMKLTTGDGELQKLAGRLIRCQRCEDFKCYEMSTFRRHWEENHNDTEEDKQTGISLSLNMIPSDSITNIV